MKILIADDNWMFRAFLRLCLKTFAGEVIEAADGETAWTVLERDDGPELAILDWEMPGRTGVEICRAIRQRGRRVYIVIFTARERHHLGEAYEVGADEVIAKSVGSVATTVATIRECVERAVRLHGKS